MHCLVEKAAFFDYFLCSSKESDPPAGEAATAQKRKTKPAASKKLTPAKKP
jgi:hypothetical protein